MVRSIGAFHLSGNGSDSDETVTVDKRAIRVPQFFSFLTRLVSHYSTRVNTYSANDILFYYISLKL